MQLRSVLRAAPILCAPLAAVLMSASPVIAQVPRAQIFNSHIVGAPLPNVGFVWGAKTPLRNDAIIDSLYYPNQRDYNRAHTIEWFQENHPDWVTYECDQTTPSYGYVYDWGAYAPLDTTSTEVRQYILDTYIKPAIARGFKAIAFDNVSLRNTDKRCGVWRGGTWFKLYTGWPIDPAHTAEKLNYITWMAQAIHSLGGKVALNAKVDPLQATKTQDLIRLSDVWVDEGGFADWCNDKVVDDLWRQKFDLIRHVTAARAYASVNYSCEPKSANMPAAEVQWTLASFLIAKPVNAYLAVLSQEETGDWIDNQGQNLNPVIGKPAAPAMSSGTVYWRAYEKALAVANISGTAVASFDLPPGSWKDLNGVSFSGTITLPKRSGLVLVR